MSAVSDTLSQPIERLPSSKMTDVQGPFNRVLVLRYVTSTSNWRLPLPSMHA